MSGGGPHVAGVHAAGAPEPGRGGLVSPPALRAGDLVAVVAPSGPVDGTALARGCAVLERAGLRVRLPATGNTASHLPDRLAADDATRARELEDAWCDPQVRAVVAARGGYGATRLLGLLDWGRMAAAGPRWLVGASDVTALHAAVGHRLGLAGILGPMPAGAVLGGPDGPEATSLRSLLAALAGRPEPLPLGEILVAGCVRGRTCGGNLAVLAALAGTAHLPDPRGAVVLLEDVGEAPYRVDRMLTQLRDCGWLAAAAGVVTGGWTRCGDVSPVLRDRLATLGVPVATGSPFGHDPVQCTLPLGVPAVLDTASGTLRVDG